MYNTMLYMSLFWGFAKKSEAKVILHSSAMLKKIKGPFYLINCWMKILNSIWSLVVCIAKNIASLLSNWFQVYYRSGHPQFTDETHSNVKKEKRETACSLSLLVYKGHVPHYNFV